MVQEALRLASDRLGQIVEDAASEVYLFSVEDFTFTLANRGARENLGYSMEELRGMAAWDIKPELSREAFLDLVEPLINGKTTTIEYETVHQRKDGSRYCVLTHLQLISTEGEKVLYAAIQDITKQKETNAALTKVSARLDAILSNTTMAIFMMDDKQQCVFMNRAAES